MCGARARRACTACDCKPGTQCSSEFLREARQGNRRRGAGRSRHCSLMLGKRKDQLRGYFDELAGRFGRNYVPGRSWKGLAEMFLQADAPAGHRRSRRG